MPCLGSKALAVHLEQGGGDLPALPTPGAFPEPAQVKRQVSVLLDGRRSLAEGLQGFPFRISG
jgi:hypothetical protein